MPTYIKANGYPSKIFSPKFSSMDYNDVRKAKAEAKKVRIKNEETGEVITLDIDKFFNNPKGTISPNQRAAADLMKIAEELSDIAHRLFVAGGADGIDERLRGNLESKAEAIDLMSMDIYKHIY